MKDEKNKPKEEQENVEETSQLETDDLEAVDVDNIGFATKVEEPKEEKKDKKEITVTNI